MGTNNDYKGIFFNNDENKLYHEGGAHFKYKELFYLLSKHAEKTRSRSKKLTTTAEKRTINSNKKEKITVKDRVKSSSLAKGKSIREEK